MEPTACNENRIPSLNTRKLGNMWKSYLVNYNVSLLLGWCYVFYLTISFYIGNGNTGQCGQTDIYWTIRLPLCVVISFAFLQNVHVYAGLVNDTDQKFVARHQVLLQCALTKILEASSQQGLSSFGVPFLLFAWSLTEIIRYGYGFVNVQAEFGLSAGLKRTLKLTAIIGAFGEQFCLWNFIWWNWNSKEERIMMSLFIAYAFCLFQLMVFYIQFKYAYNLPNWPRNVCEEEETEYDRRNKSNLAGFAWFLALFVSFYWLGLTIASSYPSILENFQEEA